MKNNVIPRPKYMELTGGYLCVPPRYTLKDPSMYAAMIAASELCDRVFGLSLKPLDIPEPDPSAFTPLTETGDAAGYEEEAKKDASPVALPGEERCETGIFVAYDASLKDGAFSIETGSACRVRASGSEGLARAFSVLVQISQRTCDRYVKIPKGTVGDSPDSPFRGLLLDVARRWHPVDYLYRYVDLCSLLGINRFVIHFTDDESYTLPSDSFPDLPSEGRHYSREELRALDSYAADRGVMIIPEIDMPGHSAQFGLKYGDVFGTSGIMDASDDAFSALETIYREASELFPNSKYIHVGGDEAILGRWSDSEKTSSYMKENGIPDLVSLYGHYVGRICSYILKLGRIPIVWEGFGKSANGLVPKETLVISWENHYQSANDLVDSGFTILNASWRPLYVVSPWQKWSQSEILGWDKYSFDHWWEKSMAYEHGVSVPKTSPVDGGMLCAWGDYLKNYESSRLACQLEYACVMPRLSAIAERLWNDEGKDFDSFSDAYRNIVRILSLIRGENAFRGEL